MNVKITPEKLKKLVSQIFEKSGLEAEEATTLSQILVNANQAGYDSHGVARVPMYFQDFKDGLIDPKGTFDIISDAPACSRVNGNWNYGPLTASKAIDLACEKAEVSGIGAVATFNTNDIARLGNYVERPARKGLISILFVNDGGASPSQAPFGTTRPFFSTNPMAVGIPTNHDYPIVIDMSSSVVALGKLRMAMNRNEQVPEGWLMETDGSTTTDPSSFFRRGVHSALLPLGGLLRGHKGFSLALMIDVLAGGLGGTGLSSLDPDAREANGLFILTINPDFFISKDDLQNRVSKLIDDLKKLPPMDGHEEVMIPGERLYKQGLNSKSELNIDQVTWDKIAKILAELQININE